MGFPLLSAKQHLIMWLAPRVSACFTFHEGVTEEKGRPAANYTVEFMGSSSENQVYTTPSLVGLLSDKTGLQLV